MTWNEYVAGFLIVLGGFFALTGGIGILRFPDFYSRIHPAGKNDTLGQFMILSGLLFMVPWSAPGGWLAGSKLVLMTVFIFITAPTATFAITKAAWLDGQRPSLDPGDGGGERSTVAVDDSATAINRPAIPLPVDEEQDCG